MPHVALQVPTDSLAEYAGIFEDPPYLGDESYLPHPEPRAAYAAMITRMDRNVGRILDLIVELDIDNDTIVMFSDGNGPFRGRKQQLFEGGIRVPMIARWPGVIGAGKVTDHLSAQWDVLPTVLELVGASETIPADIDGISFAPTLLAEGAQPTHDVMYWELGRQQAVRAGSWKLYRSGNADGEIDIVELFNLHDDPSEENNLAAEQLDVLNELLELAQRSRTPSTLFPSVFDSETGVVPGGEPLR